MLKFQQTGWKPESITIFFHLVSLLHSTKVATVAHSNRKTWTQANVLVKKIPELLPES